MHTEDCVSSAVTFAHCRIIFGASQKKVYLNLQKVRIGFPFILSHHCLRIGRQSIICARTCTLGRYNSLYIIESFQKKNCDTYHFLNVLSHYQMSHRMGKPKICIGENKDADQLRSNCEADQRPCFRYTDSTIPLLSKSKISSLLPSSVTIQLGLCRTWSEPKLSDYSRTGSN